MTLEEILEYILSSVPEDYDISAGSFFYDLLYPVAEQIRLLREKISALNENAFAMTAAGEYLDRKTAEQGLERRTATLARRVSSSAVIAGSSTSLSCGVKSSVVMINNRLSASAISPSTMSRAF